MALGRSLPPESLTWQLHQYTFLHCCFVRFFLDSTIPHPNQHSTEKLTLTCSCTHVHVHTNMLILHALIPYCAERKLFLKFKKNNHTYFRSETFGVRHHQKEILLPNYKTYGDAG